MASVIKKRLNADVYIVLSDEDHKHLENYVMDRAVLDTEILVNSLPAFRLTINGRNVKAGIRLHLKGYKKIGGRYDQ